MKSVLFLAAVLYAAHCTALSGPDPSQSFRVCIAGKFQGTHLNKLILTVIEADLTDLMTSPVTFWRKGGVYCRSKLPYWLQIWKMCSQ